MAAHSDQVKAAALAEIASGASINATAKKFGVSRSAISEWRDRADMPSPTPARQQKKADLGEQLYGYLQDSLAALRAQQRIFADPTWLRRQSAGDLAILHGVITDKTIRLLGALRTDGPDPADAVEATTEPA